MLGFWNDLASRLLDSAKTGAGPRTAATPTAIEAETIVRFEQ